VEAVCYLHTQNPSIIHGDLKPVSSVLPIEPGDDLYIKGNILIDDTGIPKICDFGLVRILTEEGRRSEMTTSSAHLGTARYLPYELVTSQDAKQLTRASDVYSMGCVGLFVCLVTNQ
jgi:serine/threonine protein kinase